MLGISANFNILFGLFITHSFTNSIKRHIVPDATVYAADVTTGTVKTLGGEDLFLVQATANEGVLIWHNRNLIKVVKADVEAKNGVIHVIDKVIL